MIRISTVREMEAGLSGANVYCGRANPKHGLEASPLGNPCSIPGVPCPVCHKVHPFKTGESVPCYRAWLWQKIQAQDPKVLAHLEMIRELHEQTAVVNLICYCVSGVVADHHFIFDGTVLTCHCQMIARAVRWLSTERTYTGTPCLDCGAEVTSQHACLSRPGDQA